MTLLPVRHASVLPEAPVASLERRNVLLWVRVGSALAEPWWYLAKAATFELVEKDMVANDTEVNFGPSPWGQDVVLRHVATGPAPDDMRIMCLLDNGPLVLPPGGIMVFARHALTISFAPPFPMPVAP
jgi:hypothetical protein